MPVYNVDYDETQAPSASNESAFNDEENTEELMDVESLVSTEESEQPPVENIFPSTSRKYDW